ncbi:MAG: hypothetical protein ACJ8EB_09195 [Allosphingosinicella sp.]
MNAASPSRAAEIVPILRSRDGRPTAVVMDDGRVLTVLNIAWGMDEGEDYEHLTTNISPRLEGASIDFFLTSEVGSLAAPETGQLLWHAG